jgi:hypothetical protein
VVQDLRAPLYIFLLVVGKTLLSGELESNRRDRRAIVAVGMLEISRRQKHSGMSSY